MASFLIVRDPDPQRRRSTRESARKALIDRYPGHQTGTFERGDAAVLWGIGRHAPCDYASTDRWDVLLIGDVIPGPGPDRVSAAAYGVEWALSPGIPPVHDGYHLALMVSEPGIVTAAADLLGIFPVYYTTAGDALLVASAPGLLRAHPQFREQMDPLAVTAILMTNGPLGGATIQRGVRRLAAGAVLQAAPGAAPTEQPQYRFQLTTAHHAVPLEECAWRFHEALRAGCRRHELAGVRRRLFLSGGLDSRLLAGLLLREGLPPEAVTRGLATDFEFKCARRVAHVLGIPHRLVPDEPGGYAEFEQTIRWNGLTASPGSGIPALDRTAQEQTPRVISGYAMGALVGGSHIGWCYSAEDHSTGFEPFFRRVNSYGLPLDTLRRLLRPHLFGDAVDQVREQVRQTYQSQGDTDLERAWRFGLLHRQRYYVGTILHRLTAGAWPGLPHIDREVLETAAGIPLPLLADRQLERDILIRFYPALAGLPLDRSSLDTTPLVPGLPEMLREHAGRLVRRLTDRVGVPRREPRYYHRIFDFDGPRWGAIRRGVAAGSTAAYEVFDRATFDALVPPVGRAGALPDPIAGAAGVKALLGVVAWLTPGGRAASA